MEPKDDSIKNRLLAQHVPEPAMLTAYRKEMEVMLEQNELRLRRDKWYSSALWIFVVLMGTTFLVLGGRQVSKPIATFLAVSACFFLISAAVKLIEYFINRSRVEILKELKRVELQVIELRETLRNRTSH